MINKILVEACVKAFKTILERENVPYFIRDDEEAQYFYNLWEETDENLSRPPFVRCVRDLSPEEVEAINSKR